MKFRYYDDFNSAVEGNQGALNLLAGNGMSMAFDNTIFSYKKLLERADFGEDHEIVRSIFDDLGTSDFESVANSIATAASISKSYSELSFSARLDEATENLKKALITAVRDAHPENRYCLSDNNVRSFQTFIDKFHSTGGTTFCLNYDLLFYWSMIRRIEGVRRSQYSDGFRYFDGDEAYVHFVGDSSDSLPNFLFPHGTLYYFERDAEVLKPRRMKVGYSIVDIIRQNFGSGSFPLFVSEGKSLQKLKRIRQNFYLNYCFEYFERCEDTFVIYGHSLDLMSDGHIFSKIAGNKKVLKIVASYFGGELERENIAAQLTRVRALAKRPDLQLGVFPANTVTCW